MGISIFIECQKRKINGRKKYGGNARNICKKIINDCWNGKYLMTSNGHFKQFWVRDFGWCTKALVNNGYKTRVVKSIEYALNTFEQKNNITTVIDNKDNCLDFPNYPADSLPWLVNSIILSKSKKIVDEHAGFIEEQARKYVRLVVDKRTGLAKQQHFSSIKDYSIRKSSTYDNTMICMLQKGLEKLGLENPLENTNTKRKMLDKLWTGYYFKNDLVDSSITGDANVFPYSAGVFTNKSMIKTSIKLLVKEKLDTPLPLKYSVPDVWHPIIFYELVKNYQGSTIWTHMGPLFIQLVKKIDKKKAEEYKKRYKNIIEHYGNYLEVFNEDLTPFETVFYNSDESMLWAANYLDL
jgi:hypothetical protein